MTTHRIDTHTHVVPPVYSEWLQSNPAYRGPIVPWSKDAALEAFGRIGVDTGILSVSAPGVTLDTTIAREVNEFCAELLRDDPAHFGFFATLLLPDVDAAIAEATYALDELHADGIVLSSNHDGIYLGAPEFDALFEVLNERNAVVFVHPTALPAPMVPGISPGIVDFLAETTRAATNITKNGYHTRFANVKFILGHGGGFLPYAANRISAGLSPTADEEPTVDLLQKFYFDTALTSGPFALPSLFAFADPAHVTFGTDWPYEIRPGITAKFTDRWDDYGVSDDLRAAVDRQNAQSLFTRLGNNS
ncbi:amidohydrolase family protein [Subtercola lobariae]|uniref:Amidohydrolase n=1 Tax=Subtercola lobariae TaxID=1588641 RepID=A0A917B2P6_9MICO|nr:amidohydrolase family protein [Subtercola lobariae]GGF17572.1 amidohydrolase [Subtercola lobariae]